MYLDALRNQVEKIGRCSISPSTPVKSLRQDINGRFILEFDSGDEIEYDHVVFATHADVTRRILGTEARHEEAKLLDSFDYSLNEVVLHSDISVSLSSAATTKGLC